MWFSPGLLAAEAEDRGEVRADSLWQGQFRRSLQARPGKLNENDAHWSFTTKRRAQGGVDGDWTGQSHQMGLTLRPAQGVPS